MDVRMDYSNAINELQADIQKLMDNADNNVSNYLDEIGEAVEAEVVRHAPRSENEYYWSNGVKKQNTHIADDVTHKVGKAKRTKVPFVSISGGKKTWSKWILASDGHVAENGKFIEGNHFVEKSAKASEDKVDSLVDSFIRKVVSD